MFLCELGNAVDSCRLFARWCGACIVGFMDRLESLREVSIEVDVMSNEL